MQGCVDPDMLERFLCTIMGKGMMRVLMDILVGYISALEYWRTVGPGFLRDRSSRVAATKHARAALSNRTKPCRPGGTLRPGGCLLPVHVLVGCDAMRTETHALVSHTWSCALPDGDLFVDAGEGFFVSTPEFCFLQMASKLTLANLIQLGFELCGTYSLRKDGPAAPRKKPLTSSDKLKAFVAKAAGAPGCKKAVRALRYVLDGSASPKETELAMYLCLPYALGGYGIERPRLNYHIDIPPSMRKFSNKSYCVCDLCWPDANLVFEYDSKLHHSGEGQRARDSKRSNTLISLGYTVVSVTSIQIGSGEDVNKLAQIAAKFTGKRLRYRDPGFTRKHWELSALLSKPPI